jgi:ectoine hydroxylase-related dioxygenase (phytanoyl-CoA dioxygenase family)
VTGVPVLAAAARLPTVTPVAARPVDRPVERRPRTWKGTDVSALRDAIEGDLAAIEAGGYTVIPELLPPDLLAEMRRALAPHLQARLLGRNDFEGTRTERVYALVGRHELFERLVEHPRILGICDALLETNYLLTASQAINIHPGETAQPFHTDDAFYRIPRPRKAVSVSTIVAIDPFTAENGATQVVPGSHRWSDAILQDPLAAIDFTTLPPEERRPREPGALPEPLAARLVDAVMPAGSVLVFLGTLLHRGGANRSDRPRLALSNQYCEPWARQQESYLLAIPRERARAMSARVQALLGYSVHPPFMGHVNGVHPRRLLDEP